MVLLVFVAGVVPVVPAAMRDEVVEVSEGVDDPGVLAHGPPHVERACPCDPAPDKGEPRLLVRRLPAVRRDGPEPRGYRVELAILHVHVPPQINPKPNQFTVLQPKYSTAI